MKIKRKHKIPPKAVHKEAVDATQEMVSYWKEYWKQLQEATDDSESKLDDKVFAISAGGIGLLLGTMGIGGKDNLSDCIWLAIVSLIMFGFALLFDVYYYRKSIKNHDKQFRAIGDFINNPQGSDEFLCQMIENDNKKLDHIFTTAFTLSLLGIVSFAAYILTNLL